jgi:DNA-directed DNA polymerase III PolC
MVSYLLGITPADPIKYNLLFERFLNPDRTDPPDIDLDLSWKHRDKVLDYVYEKYGHDRAAMISTHVTFNYRSAIREVAKAHGLAEREIRLLTRGLPHYFHGNSSLEETKEKIPEAKYLPTDDHRYEKIYHLAERILEHPRHLGIHPGGIVIAPFRLDKSVPLQRATKGIVITQFEMHSIEDLGLVKIDLLGQRSLAVIADMVRVLRKKYGVKFDPSRMPELDDLTKRLIRDGQTMGIFQIESPGMRGLLKKLKVDSFEMITAASSVIRPGPADSGMLRHFVRRHLGQERVKTVHPKLGELLRETYGIMLYQEDVIKVAHEIAGWSLAESDRLRRSMSGKRVEEPFMEHRNRFIQDAVRRGVNVEAAMEIWRQMESFSGYAFCKAHSAAYSVLSVQGTWLKAHYPAEFLAAVMSNYGGFYHTSCYLEEARRMGIRILPPDVNKSMPWFTAMDRKSSAISRNSYEKCEKTFPAPPWIRIGLLQIKGLTQKTLTAFLDERERRPFESLEDFCNRTPVGYREAQTLIRAGALDGFGYTRPMHLWRLELIFSGAKKSDGAGFFPGSYGSSRELIPALDYPLEKKLRDELEVLELTIEAHPLFIFQEVLKKRKPFVHARDLHRYKGKQIRVVGWLITTRRAKTKSGEQMRFLSLEDLTGTMECVLFPETYRKYGSCIASRGPYIVEGIVEDDFGHYPLTVVSLERIDDGEKNLRMAGMPWIPDDNFEYYNSRQADSTEVRFC